MKNSLDAKSRLRRSQMTKRPPSRLLRLRKNILDTRSRSRYKRRKKSRRLRSKKNSEPQMRTSRRLAPRLSPRLMAPS